MSNEKKTGYLEAFYKKRVARSRPTIKDSKVEESNIYKSESQKIFEENIRKNIRKLQEQINWTSYNSNSIDADLEKMYPHFGEPAKFYTQIPKNNIQETENRYSFVVQDFSTDRVLESQPATAQQSYKPGDSISPQKPPKPRYNKVAERVQNEKSDFDSGIENMKRNSEKESTEVRYKPISTDDYTAFKSLSIPDPMVDFTSHHISFENDEEGPDPYIE